MQDKKIPLSNLHESLGGKMVPFGGFIMPVRYSSDIEEHHAVRNAVGVFDVSHMGEFLVEGPNALDLIQWISSNDASILIDSKVQYGYLPNFEGGIVDDFLTYKLEDEKYYLVVNASNIEKDWNWINAQNSFGAKLSNLSWETCLFAVQGPKATATLSKLTDMNLADMDYYTCQTGTLAGFSDILISTTGYTGAGGYEVYCKNENAEAIWKAIFEAGEEFGIKPIGLGARDTLRLEMGYCLYGNDISDTTSPLEAGLGWVTKFTKNFINREDLENQKKLGVKKKLVGLKMIDRGIPRSHYEVYASESEHIGEITSGTQSPTLGLGIAMAYLPLEKTKIGTEVFIKIREKYLKAVVTKLPFLS